MKTRIGVLCLCLLAVALAACQPRGVDVPFETIERTSYSKWMKLEPGLIIATTTEEIKPINDLVLPYDISKDGKIAIQNVDFETEFVIAIFLGSQASGHEGIEIERILRQNEQVSILVHEGRPKGTEEEASPYHLVKVHENGDWSQVTQFTIYLDGEESVSTSIYVP